MNKDVVTEPGIYRDMSVEEYDLIPAVRRTFLWDLHNQSPGHAIYNSENRVERKVFATGTMVHTSFLQPEEFPRKYVVMPPFENDELNLTAKGDVPKAPKNTSFYKDKVDAFRDLCASTGAEIVTQDDYNMAYEIGRNIREHEIAQRFFKRGSSNEAVAVARDTETGLLLKARFDCLVEEGMPTAADVKTAQSAHPAYFRYSVRKFGYYFQDSFYLKILRLLGLKNPNFLFIVCEKTPPYPVSVYECQSATGKLGDLHVTRALKRYKECTAAGEWPFYGSGIQTIELSDFDLKELEDA